jgi:molybdopterin-containing oxidoreductase family iron-sulfur binding subunit
MVDTLSDDPREFLPEQVEAALAAFDRRTFLKLMGATLAAAGAGCARTQPMEKIVPYVRSPENVIPGIPTFYASAFPVSGFASGFGRGGIVESHEGRPTKIEGNPLHPSSLGATDIFMQAAALQLYDPDRSQLVLDHGQGSTWGQLLQTFSDFVKRHGDATKMRVRLLSRTLTSPSVLAQIEQLHAVFPQFRWHIDDTPGCRNEREGQRQALGSAVTTLYDFTRAKRIVSLDAHFLADDPGSVRYAREYAQGRRIASHPFSPNKPLRTDNFQPSQPTEKSLTRLYVAESTLTFTGARADHRLPVQPSRIPQIATALADAILGGEGATKPDLPQNIAQWVKAAAADLLAHPRESLLLVGECHPPDVHALAHAINARLDAPQNTLRYMEPVDGPSADADTLENLVNALAANEVDLLLMIDVNPAFTAPPDSGFTQALQNFAADENHMVIHLGGYVDETATLATHHVPLAHTLETWSDIRGHDGTISIIQPLIEPLWRSKSILECLAALRFVASASTPSASYIADTGYELLRAYWFDQWKQLSPAGKEKRWRKSLRDGIIENTAIAPAQTKTPDAQRLLNALRQKIGDAPKSQTTELAFRLDPTLGDGESGWANHAWLQELPKPLTHLTWDNLALLAPGTAKDLGITDWHHASRLDVPAIRIEAGGQTIEIPVWVQVGHPEKTITLHLGSGHAIGGSIQRNVGTNVNPLRTMADRWNRTTGDIKITKLDRTVEVACQQPTQIMSGRDVARSRTIQKVPRAPEEETPPDLYSTRKSGGKSVHLSLYDENLYPGYKWAMVIDLGACIGCNACVIACQAENNIPCVGKDQVRRGREMHWIRIDTYFGPTETQSLDDVSPNPEIHLLPMLCQHCENAPCEVVCPVEATTHSSEGINEMTYNRCVGTRYCSNNCPYKVRRFNFLAWNAAASHGMPADADALAAMQRNPNVTVRSRGVMEKCNYCIQRINRARINAKRDWANSEAPATATPKPTMRDPISDGWFKSGKAEELPRLAIQTACQQACPTEAIIFGDMNDAASAVNQLKTQHPWSSINYGVFTDLNTQPRTSYLERLLNHNLDLEPRPGGAA